MRMPQGREPRGFSGGRAHVAVGRPAEDGHSQGGLPCECHKDGSRRGSRGAEPMSPSGDRRRTGIRLASRLAKRMPQGREPRGFSGGRAP